MQAKTQTRHVADLIKTNEAEGVTGATGFNTRQAHGQFDMALPQAASKALDMSQSTDLGSDFRLPAAVSAGGDSGHFLNVGTE